MRDTVTMKKPTEVKASDYANDFERKIAKAIEDTGCSRRDSISYASAAIQAFSEIVGVKPEALPELHQVIESLSNLESIQNKKRAAWKSVSNALDAINL